MKSTKKMVVFALSAILALSSCTVRLVDFTTISSKNVNLGIDRSLGKKTSGEKSYFLGIGWNIKDALDEALEKAGPEYDMLIDGVVRYSSYPFVSSVSVEGTAIKSSALKKSLGDAGYKLWLEKQNVFDANEVEVASNK
ncbi:MAG: hypothetical protein IT258_01455 [Saprospiraceae bacterium]|nr:hypothetical protein [Saprospiraceae bacterium]